MFLTVAFRIVLTRFCTERDAVTEALQHLDLPGVRGMIAELVVAQSQAQLEEEALRRKNAERAKRLATLYSLEKKLAKGASGSASRST